MDKKSIINEAEYLKNLENIEKEWTEKLDREDKIEKEIADYVEIIAERLLLSKDHNSLVNIDKRRFYLGFKVHKNQKGIKVLSLAILDIALQQLVGKNSGISTVKKVEVEYVNEFTLKSNLKAAIEAWLRSVTGNLKAEYTE